MNFDSVARYLLELECSVRVRRCFDLWYEHEQSLIVSMRPDCTDYIVKFVKKAIDSPTPRLNACLVRVLICIGQWDAENRTSHERYKRKKGLRSVRSIRPIWNANGLQFLSPSFSREATDAADGRSKWAISRWPKEGRFVDVWLTDLLSPNPPATEDGGAYVATHRILSWILQRIIWPLYMANVYRHTSARLNLQREGRHSGGIISNVSLATKWKSPWLMSRIYPLRSRKCILKYSCGRIQWED